IYKGGGVGVASNNKLGKLNVWDLMPVKRSEPLIAVAFEIDVNGMLNVPAHDKKPSARANTTISSNRGCRS
ncbi:hypothetical protein PHYSODRAFT_530254, partial [Phytophthora sojae]